MHASLQRPQCLKPELAACAFRARDDASDAPLAAPPRRQEIRAWRSGGPTHWTAIRRLLSLPDCCDREGCGLQRHLQQQQQQHPQAPVPDMEVPGLADSISSPLSPCEGMIKDLSLDAIQLCERDGEAFPPFHAAGDPVSD